MWFEYEISLRMVMKNKNVIAFNARRSGDAMRDGRGYVETWTREQVDDLLRQPWLKQMVEDIHGGDEAKKEQLPFICPHYTAFRNNHRAQADILPETFTFMTCVDIDDKSLVAPAIERAMVLNSEEGGEWQDMVLRMAYSARKKLHIYLRLPVGRTIEETQVDFCRDMEIPFDESCLTPERLLFVTGVDEEIYRSEQWLEALSDEEIDERREAYLNRGLDMDGRKLKKGKASPATKEPIVMQDKHTSGEMPIEMALYVFDACMKEAGLSPEVLVNKGGRHKGLLSILSVGLTQLLEKDELNAVLRVRMPNNWQDKNIQQLVNDFYEKYTEENGKLNQFLRKVLAESLKIGKKQEAVLAGEAAVDDQTGLSPLSLLYDSNQPPVMPAVVPRLIKLLISNTPKIYQATVAHAVFPPLGAHLKDVKFLYTDNVLHEATLMNIAMAGSSTGKGCVDAPINHIMADIRERDKENERRLKEFNDANNRKGANKDKLERPDDLVIQEIQADVTHAGFVQRLDEAQHRFLYFKLNEIEMFDQLKSKPGQQFLIICQSFDPENRYGQTRAGSQSVNATVCIRFNWNSCGTIAAVQQYFAKQLTKGPISRINFCTIPEREIGAEQPVYGGYDEKFDEQLRPYIKNLTDAHGVIVCKQARKLARELIAECAEFSRLSQDRVFENLSFRANVIAYLKACVLYVANGCKWEKAIEEFIRWSLHYDLWCKMKYFGEAIRIAESAPKTSKRGPVNMLAMLPDEFTFDDAVRVRLQNGKDRAGTNNMLNQWVFRNYLLRITDYSFKKLKYTKENNNGSEEK